MLSDSQGRPGFKSQPGRTLHTCNFVALEVTAMYFTFLETSNLFLFGQERSRVQLYVQSMICYREYPQVYFIKSQRGISLFGSLYLNLIEQGLTSGASELGGQVPTSFLLKLQCKYLHPEYNSVTTIKCKASVKNIGGARY